MSIRARLSEVVSTRSPLLEKGLPPGLAAYMAKKNKGKGKSSPGTKKDVLTPGDTTDAAGNPVPKGKAKAKSLPPGLAAKKGAKK